MGDRRIQPVAGAGHAIGMMDQAKEKFSEKASLSPRAPTSLPTSRHRAFLPPPPRPRL